MSKGGWLVSGTTVVSLGTGSRTDIALKLLQEVERGAVELSSAESQLKDVLSTLEGEEIVALFNDFIERASRHAAFVQNSAPLIKQALENVAKDLEHSMVTQASLKATVRKLEQQVAKLTAESDARDEQVLLCQLAYVLDEVGADFVFREGKRPRSCSIGMLRSMAAENALTEEQMRRWNQLKIYMSKKGWTIYELEGTTGTLRTTRFPHAHGTPEQQEKTTPSMIDGWVEKHYGEDEDVRLLVQLVSNFTQPDKPLCKNPNCTNIILEELTNPAAQ